MSRLLDELKRKYRTPQEAMTALGMDSALLTAKEQSMKVKPLSRTAIRVNGALAAFMLPHLASDAMPKFITALAPGLKDLTRKNFKERKASLAKFAKDAAMPLMTPEAKAAGATPDDVMLKILDMVGSQAESEPAEMDEQPAAVTEPNAGAPAAGGYKAKVAEALKAAGMDEEAMGPIMDMMPDEVADDAETEEEKKAREEKEKAAADAPDPKLGPKAGEPMDRKAMDAALKTARDGARKDTLAELGAIRIAERLVRPLIGEVTTAMDSAEAIYRAALEHEGVELEGVHPSAFPTLVKMRVDAKEVGDKPRRVANDSALADDRATFDKEHGIVSRRPKNLGVA